MQVSFSSAFGSKGDLAVRKSNHIEAAPLSWTLRNRLTRRFISGWLAYHLAKAFSAFTGLVLGTRILTIVAELSIRKRVWYHPAEGKYFLELLRAGKVDEAEAYAVLRTYWIDYGVVSYRVVTDAFAAYLVDDLDNGAGSADVSLFNFHGIGTTNTAEAVGDTALVAESTTALNPDNTRATGTRSQPAANQYRSTGTLTADAAIAAVEHGLFTTSATGSGTLADRSVYTVVNIASAESLQTQYTLTVTSGG